MVRNVAPTTSGPRCSTTRPSCRRNAPPPFVPTQTLLSGTTRHRGDGVARQAVTGRVDAQLAAAQADESAPVGADPPVAGRAHLADGGDRERWQPRVRVEQFPCRRGQPIQAPGQRAHPERAVTVLRERDQVIGTQAVTAPERREPRAVVAHQPAAMGGHPDDAATIDEHLQDPFDGQAVVWPERGDDPLVDAAHAACAGHPDRAVGCLGH